MLYVLLAFVVLLFLFSTSQKKKRRSQAAALSNALEPGVRVVTTSGIFGIVVEIESDTVVVEISEGIDVRFKKQAVMGVVPHLADESTGSDRHADADDETGIDGITDAGFGAGAATLDDAALHAELDAFDTHVDTDEPRATEESGKKGPVAKDEPGAKKAPGTKGPAAKKEPSTKKARQRGAAATGHEPGTGAVPTT